MPASAPPAAAIASGRRWAVLGVLLVAAALDLLESTITTIAAPTIAADLRGGGTLVQWLGSSYALALGALLVVGGRLGDRYGRRRLFLIGITGFTLASLACGLAFGPVPIITARLVQGAFGALLIPQGFGIIGAVFPRERRGAAFSAFAPVMGLSSVCGPILAGFLIDADILGLGWRPVFLINIVLGGAVILAAVLLLPKDVGDPAVSVDGIGSGLLAGAMLGLLYGVIEGSGNGWTLLSVLLPACGAVSFVLFCRRQRSAANPLIAPSLLRNRGFSSGLVLGAAFFAAVAGLVYVLSLFLQHGLGYGPPQAAIGMAPVAVGIVTASIASHRFINGLGRELVLIGLLITLAGTGWMLALVLASGTSVGPWALIPPVLLIGLGMGTCFGAIYDAALGDVAPQEAGSAGGSLQAVQQLANAVGAAAVTTVYFTALPGGGEARAMTAGLVTVAAVAAACCVLVRLLPRTARSRDRT